jgi:hypothetical protein
MENRVININGAITRVWTYKPEYGYGCAECCNGDRCDDDCTAKYRRPNCPHCKGKGWIKEVPASDYAALQAKCERYEAALKIVRDWKLPSTGQFWDNDETQPMSYEALKGTNGARDFIRNVAKEALSAGEGEKEEIIEDKDAKAWDEWRDSLVKHDNILVHHKERSEKYFEPFTLEEFKTIMLEKSPVFIYNTMYSKDKPLYQITSRFMPSGVEFFCASWADKTPKRVTLEKFYHRLKVDGLEYAEF